MIENSPETTLEGSQRNLCWRVIQYALQILFPIWFRYRAKGLENIPPSGGGLVLSNHQSFLDPLLLGLPLKRPISFMARDSLFRIPVIGWILRNTYVFPINRSAATTSSIRNAIDRMQRGYLVGLFPEGTRSEDGSVSELKPGVIALLRRTELPIYPVGIDGAYEAMPRGALVPRMKRICVVFGEPILPEELSPYLQKGKESELIELLRQRLIRMAKEAELWKNS